MDEPKHTPKNKLCQCKKCRAKRLKLINRRMETWMHKVLSRTRR